MLVYLPLTMQREYERPFKSYPQSTTADNLPLGFYGSAAMTASSYMQQHHQPHHSMANGPSLLGLQPSPNLLGPSHMSLPPLNNQKLAPSPPINVDTVPLGGPQQAALKEPSAAAGHDRSETSSPSNSATSDGDGEQDGFRMPPKKRPHQVPPNEKDDSYWEKRRKNNESAKRSRDARRMKEEQIAMRVVFLEQENLQLRTEVSLLRSEIEKLRCMLYNS